MHVDVFALDYFARTLELIKLFTHDDEENTKLPTVQIKVS